MLNELKKVIKKINAQDLSNEIFLRFNNFNKNKKARRVEIIA